MLNALAVFIAMAVTDAIYALYNRRSVQGHAHAAATLAAMLITTSAIVTIFYTQNHLLVPAAAAGAYVGTYVAVRRDHAKDQTNLPAGAEDSHTAA